MQISPDWLRDRSLQLVMERISAQGFEVYCVGGCVRDGLEPSLGLATAICLFPKTVFLYILLG